MSQFSPLSIGVDLVAVFIVVMILSRVFGGPKVDYIQCPYCQKTMQKGRRRCPFCNEEIVKY